MNRTKAYKIMLSLGYGFALFGSILDAPHMYKVGIANMIYSAYVLLKDEKS